jgi:TonB-dependent receptor
MFPREKIGDTLEIEEGTRADDAYEAGLNVFAGYVMADLALGDQLRLIAGPRVEASRHTIRSYDPFSADIAPIEVEKDYATILPGASLVYSVTDDINLRFGGSRTLARPQLRELAPFSFTNYFGDRPQQGNPDLEETRIWNADLRFEWFPTLREVLATSVFYKRFIDPIESIVLPRGNRGIETYANAESANLFGVEVEARKSFDFMHAALEDLSLIANFTIAYSKIELTEAQAGIATSRDRPLSQQAPYAINVALDYTNEDIGFSARVLYNIVGPNIVAVGTNGLPDIYVQPQHLLDAVVAQEVVDGFELKLTGKNLVNTEIKETQEFPDGERVVHSYRKGTVVTLGATYTY